MKDRKPEKTLVAIRLTKEKTEVFWLIVGLLILVFVLGVVGGGQYYFCQKEHPGRDFLECVRAWR